MTKKPEMPAFVMPKHGGIPAPVTTALGLTRYDAIFAIISGFRALELELYVPQSAAQGSPVPVIVYMHGGGYAGGNRKEGTPWFERSEYRTKALAAGFAFASIDYRLGYEATFPAAVNDAHAALRWLTKFAAKLNLDMSRTILWGESAGAHLAALTANTVGNAFFEGIDGAEPQTGCNIIALVDWYGATDLNTIVRPMDGTDLSLPESFRYPPEYFNLGAKNWLDPNLRKQASPTSYVCGSSPKTLLVHGNADGMVPIQQSEVLVAALSQHQVEHQFVVIEGADHGWMGLPQPQINAIVDQTIGFMTQVAGI